jgi:hypothetical protein
MQVSEGRFELFGLSILFCGCAPRSWNTVGQPVYVPPSQSTVYSASPVGQKLMLFGGLDHKVYLGCLNCSEYALDSVRNEYGLHGSPYAMDSIFNSFGQYGSPYSMYSACNSYATDPPVIVDRDGAFYGRLTVNRYNVQRTRNENLIEWLEQVVCK